MDNKSFIEVLNKIKKSDRYWEEKAIIDFVSDLNIAMKKKNITNSEFARILGKSRAYVSKVLSGQENFTIKTMVRLVRALDGYLCINLSDRPSEFKWNEVVKKRDKVRPLNLVVFHSWAGNDEGLGLTEPLSYGENGKNAGASIAA